MSEDEEPLPEARLDRYARLPKAMAKAFYEDAATRGPERQCRRTP